MPFRYMTAHILLLCQTTSQAHWSLFCTDRI